MARVAFLLLISMSCFECWGQTLLSGTWQYYAYRYRGAVLPSADPSLVMRFQFKSSGTDDLSWKNDSGIFCERRATYSAINGEINEDVTWINPKNSAECASDPNMQIGQSRFSYRVVHGQLEIDADLGDEIITYLWQIL